MHAREDRPKVMNFGLEQQLSDLVKFLIETCKVQRDSLMVPKIIELKMINKV